MPEIEGDETGKVPFPIKSVENDDTPDAPEGQQDSDDSEREEKSISQTELDRILQKRLKRQEEQFQKKLADYEKYKEDAAKFRKLEDEKATDAERWEREKAQFLTALQEKDEKLTSLERSTLVSDMAVDAKLPKKLWRYVEGNNADEIEESIKQIVNDFDLDSGEEGGDKPKDKPRKRSNAVYGGGGENVSPDPDTDVIVSKIPRGPQFRLSKNSR